MQTGKTWFYQPACPSFREAKAVLGFWGKNLKLHFGFNLFPSLKEGQAAWRRLGGQAASTRLYDAYLRPSFHSGRALAVTLACQMYVGEEGSVPPQTPSPRK